MELMELAIVLYILTFLIPINGLMLIRNRQLVERNRRHLREMWRFSRRR